MTIWYGGDYNPEQWPREVWDEDVQLMRRGGVNLVTVGVFSWARLEPRRGEYDFGWLDDVLDLLHADGDPRRPRHGDRVAAAVARACGIPRRCPVTEGGVRLAVGSRQQYCPSSPVYRRRAARSSSTRLAERYAGHPALELWHINNEYGCHVSHCYCDVSAPRSASGSRRSTAHRGAQRAWGTAFWSQRYDAFEEVSRRAPRPRSATRPSCSTSTASRATSCSPATGPRSR